MTYARIVLTSAVVLLTSSCASTKSISSIEEIEGCVEIRCVGTDEAETISENTRKMYTTAGYRVPVYIPELVFPREIERRNIEGTVVVQFDVDELGRVLDPVVISTTMKGLTNEHAMNYMLEWRFEAAETVKRGQKQRVTYDLE